VLGVGTSDLNLFAKGLAVALEQDSLRLQLLEDMRDSPFEHHTLHLRSYLQGQRGRSVRNGIAAGLGWENGDAVMDLLGSDNVALLINPPIQRETWRGEADLVIWPVVGTVTSDTAVGYRTGGDSLVFGVSVPTESPFLLVHQSKINFGADAEQARLSAPKAARGTIAVPGEHFGGPPVVSALTSSTLASAYCNEGTGEGCDICIDFPDDPECTGEDPPGPGPGYYYIPGTENCVNYVVLGGDWDGILDGCEQLLAAAMAPKMLIDFGDNAPTWEPYYAVEMDGQTATGQRLFKIFYAIAYHRDGGSFGHNGDSEYVVVWAIERGSGYWSRYRIFTAAHVNSPAESSKWWASDTYGLYWPYITEIYPAFVSDRPMAPQVWVSRDKHANYGSKSDCNSGGGFYGIPIYSDTCTGYVIGSDFVAYSDGNLGRGGRHDPPMRNCTVSRSPPPDGDECFWSDYAFYGWSSVEENGTTAYLAHLNHHDFN
jgi:hypothetical protein